MAEAMNLQFTTGQIQGASVWIFWVLLSLIFLGIIGYMLYLVWKSTKYKIIADVREKVGENFITKPDKVRKVKVEDTWLYHYKNLNKYSPVFDSKFLYIIKKRGIFNWKSFIGFTAYKYEDKIVPCTIKENLVIEPIDYDAWNYLVQRIRINHTKYERNQQLRAMMPYIALGVVMMAFIVGSILWGQHVEKVATGLINSAETTARNILETSGAQQIIS